MEKPSRAPALQPSPLCPKTRRFIQTFEKEERVDKAFENLTMGRSYHAEFRGEFEDRLEDFVVAEMPVPDVGALKRK